MVAKEHEPFLSTDDKCELLFEESLYSQPIKPRSRWLPSGLMVHILLVAVYTLTSFIIIQQTTAHCGEMNQVFAGLAVKYKPQLYTKFNESPFAGPPSLETDIAWHELMGNMSIRVSKAELEAHGQKSVQLPGGGYLAWLGVFHELHCVKMLRQWSYREHYHPNMTAHDRQHLEVHIDHCIDWLRSAAMCHADTSALATFKWDKTDKPMLDTRRVPHRCVDWEEMLSSHKNRMVSHEEVASMTNPALAAA